MLVTVKAHRGDPLIEESDIRSEMGRRKEIKEVGWNDPTNRTIYRWKVGQITRSTTWTTVTQSETDFVKKREKSKYFEHWN